MTNQNNWKRAIATEDFKEFNCEKCNKISKTNDKSYLLQIGEHAYCIHCPKYIWIHVNRMKGGEINYGHTNSRK